MPSLAHISYTVFWVVHIESMRDPPHFRSFYSMLMILIFKNPIFYYSVSLILIILGLLSWFCFIQILLYCSLTSVSLYIELNVFISMAFIYLLPTTNWLSVLLIINRVKASTKQYYQNSAKHYHELCLRFLFCLLKITSN